MQPLVPVITFLLTSIFFSGIETAFTSANKLKIEVDKSRNLFSARILSRFIKNQRTFISTLWLGNILSLVAFAIYSDIYFRQTVQAIYQSQDVTAGWLIALEILIIALTYFIIAELLPRIVFRTNANVVLKVTAVPVLIIYILFYPLIKFFIIISEFVLKHIFRVELIRQEYTFSAGDLDNLLKDTTIETNKESDEYQELQMFMNARDLSNLKVRDFMVPRNEIIAIEKNESLDDLRKLIVDSGHSKILVYDQSIDNIVGYSHAFDIFSNPAEIESIIKPVIIVPGTITAERLLNTFIRERKSVALVVDEFGGTDGMLTIEDILEEIFGDIDDEYDVREFEDKQINENEYLVAGRDEIDYLNEKYDLGIAESDEYITLAGYIIFNRETIPSENEIITIENLTFHIIKATESRIEQVLVKKNQQ